MRRAYSELFHLSPESWLGRKLDADTQLVVSPKVALTFECRANKGESLSAALQSEEDDEGLKRYVITDTQVSHSRYWKMVVEEGIEA